MANVLSWAKNSTIPPSISNEPRGRSCSSVASIGSGCTVQHNRLRSISTSSLSSVGSYLLPSLRRPGDSSIGTPPRSASFVNLSKIHTPFDRNSDDFPNSRRTSFASAYGGRITSNSTILPETKQFKLVGLAECEHEPSKDGDGIGSDHDPDTDNPGETSENTLHLALDTPIIEEASSPLGDGTSREPAFRRWVSKLRQKRQQFPPAVTPRRGRWVLDDFDGPLISSPRQRHSAHRRSDSPNSSIRFVTAMRSATATLASASIATISRRTSKWRRGQQRSSVISERDPRPSVDSMRSTIDEAAKQRSRKRREKLEELIRTEESYVADIKALSNAYFTILGQQATSASFARPSAQRTIANILHLHDDILGHLYGVVPFAEYDQNIAKMPNVTHLRSHTRWHSVDVVPQRTTPTRTLLASIKPGRRSLNLSRSTDEDAGMLCCSPDIIAGVTKVFASHIDRFAAYEEFGANYDLIQRDIEETQQMISVWPDFDKAIEALSAHVNPVRSREANRKKAMTIKDLLIKPVQRIPRYELLFSDLCNFTPVCDDPNAHAAIDGLCTQLNETCQRMNQAKDNPSRARTLETTCLIGDRLSFSSQVTRSIFLQLLGHVTLCGSLYVAYRNRDRVKGRYMICVLFESTLLLASAEDDQPKYSTLAGIAMANATIEETDNSKGLQCHTAPHSWKVIFEHSARMYEIILVACSAIEAEVWRAHLATAIECQARAVAESKANVFELHSPLTSEMKSIGKAFGKPGSFVRRMSVHRTATVGPTTDLNQVIIKNTQAVKEMHDHGSETSLQIPRSQSVQTPSHVQTLAPRRADRHRLEAILSDVWSKGLLPYPGMVRRSDPIRASANHVIRKFSMASITSNFSSKRTPSYTSIASSRKEDVPPAASKREGRMTYPARPPLVNFHNAPDAFLPADFQLQDPETKRKKSALRTFTMTMERPFSPLLGNESKPSGLRRAQSVRDVNDGSTAAAMPSPILPSEKEARKAQMPADSGVRETAKASTSSQVTDDLPYKDGPPTKTPRKSKSRILQRLFG